MEDPAFLRGRAAIYRRQAEGAPIKAGAEAFIKLAKRLEDEADALEKRQAEELPSVSIVKPRKPQPT